MEIINSNKGGAKVCYEGHMYTKQVIRKTKVWWRCVKRSSGQCRGSLTTNLSFENPEIVQLHNHEKDESKIQVAKVRNFMKFQALGSQENSNDILIPPIYVETMNISQSIPLVKTEQQDMQLVEEGSPIKSERLFLIDTDPGLDDAQAILMALAVDNINVLALTTVQGNASSYCSCVNALRLLKVADRLDIPVYLGCERPMVSPPLNATYYHGEDGFVDMPDSEAPGLNMAQTEHAVFALINLIQKYPGEVTLVTLGPLTNVAMAIRLEPNLGTKIKDCYIMGGNYRGVGNITRSAEFNFANDPEAAQIVLTELKCPITMITWELCTDMQQPYAFWQKLISLPGQKAAFMQKLHHHLNSRQQIPDFFVFCDELAMAVAIDDGIILEGQNLYAEVETQGKITKGQLVLDWKNVTGKPANVRIVTNVNIDRFEELLINSFNK